MHMEKFLLKFEEEFIQLLFMNVVEEGIITGEDLKRLYYRFKGIFRKKVIQQFILFMTHQEIKYSSSQ